MSRTLARPLVAAIIAALLAGLPSPRSGVAFDGTATAVSAWAGVAGALDPVAFETNPATQPDIASLAPAASTAYARAYRSGPRTDKVVALTFDDAYRLSQTRAIFRILQEEHVKATFFPYARAMKLDPALWRQIAAAGYPIGNHTYSHANLTRLSTAAVVSELTRARATIKRITGLDQPAIMRPPYGAYTTATRQAAALAGYRTIATWDVDTRDWSGISVSTIVARGAIGKRGSIVLMHAGPANTPLALRAIIARYRARGYTFVTVPELLGLTGP